MELRRILRIWSPQRLLRTAVRAVPAAFGVLGLTATVMLSLAPTAVTAVQSVPYLINFQGRLTDNNGNVLSDGSYNIKFRIFNAASSGTNLWEGDRVMGTSDRRVQVQNGLFNIQFGDTSLGDPALSPSLFNTQTNANLYLEVELPTPATATCATNGCANFAEGAMTPRQPLSSSPYAFNSDTLDGLDSAAFGQLSAIQSWTDTNTYSKSGGAAIVLSGTAASGGSILQIGSALSGGSGSGTLFGANTTSAGDLINLQVSSSLRLKVDNAGALTTGSTITSGAGIGASGDLTFTNGAARTISIAQATSGAGNDLTIRAGQSNSGSATNGGNLILQAGATGGTGTSGSVIVRANGTETATAFQIQNASNAPAFTVDTVANKIVIGDATGVNTATSLLVVDTATADPTTGYNGAMYYNSTLNIFRCYQNNSWGNCGANITATANSQQSFLSGLQNVAGTATGTAVETLVFTSSTAVSNVAGVTGFTAPAAGSFRSCLTKNNAAITGGTLNLRWRVNGVSVGSAACSMNSTTNRQSASALDSGVVTFSAGDTIGIAYDSSGLLPAATNDFTTYWSVEYNASSGNGLTLQFVYDSSSTPAGISLTNAKNLVVTAADTATDPSYLVNLQCTTCSANGGRFAVQNNGTDAFTVNPNGAGIVLGQNTSSSGNITSTMTALNGTSTANGAGTAATSLILTSATNFDVGNYVQVNSANCGGTGVNPCYAKITAKASNTLTITPALTWTNGSTVNEYNIPEIGGSNTTQALANRFGRGYFISGVAAGNGTTFYNEDSIETNLTNFDLLTTNVTNLNIGTAATNLTLGTTSTTVSVAGSLTVTGDIIAPAAGTAGYWTRSGTTIQPANSGDDLNLGSGDLTTSGTLDAASYSVGGAAGTSATCTGGQMLQNPTLVNGILTGGTCATPSGTGANTNLSNVASTAIPADLVASTNNTRSLGSASLVWQNVYTGNLDAGTTTTTLGIGTAATTTAITIGRSGLAASLPGGLTTSGANINAGTGTITGNGSGLTNLAAGNLSGTLPALNAGSLTNLNASSLATGSGAVSVQSGGSSALTIGSASGTILLSSATTTLQKAATAFTIDVNNAASSTLTITNAGAGIASLSVEGGVAIGSGQAYTVGASAGQSSTVSCSAGQAVTSATFTGGILTTAPGCATISGTGATTALSNLAAVAINQSLVANANNTLDLGTSGTAWRTGYFATSVTSPTYTGSAAVTLQSGGTSALTLDSASGTLVLGSATATLQKSATAFTIDLNNASASTLTITNAGTGVASLDVEGGINIGSGQTYKINNIQISSAALSNDSSITKQGNTFNGTSQLVQTNGSGALPALSGANLTSLTAANLTGALPAISGASLTNLNPTNLAQGSGAVTLQSAAATALTITANAASTFSTSSGQLTLQSGSGTVSLGSSTVLTASGTLAITAGGTAQNISLNPTTTGTVVIGGTTPTVTSAGALTVSAGGTAQNISLNPSTTGKVQIGGTAPSVTTSGATALVVDPGGAAALSLGSANASAITLGRSGITTTTNGAIAITATAAPTTDQLAISNVGQPVTTAGVNGLNITYVGGTGAIEASGARIDTTPGGTSGSTWSGLRIVSTTNASSGVALNGIKIDGPGAGGAGTETGLNITTGWDVGVNIQSGGIQMTAMSSDPTAPASGSLKVYARTVAGRTMLKSISSSGIDFAYQPSLFQQNVFLASPGSQGSTGNLSAIGAPITMGAGTYTNTLAGSEAAGYMANWATTTTTGTAVGFMQSTSQYYRGSVANGTNGFFAFTRMAFPDTITGYQGTTGVRFWAGLTSQTTVAGMTSSDTPTGDYAGFRISGNASETTFRFLTRNNATTTNTNTLVTMAQNKMYDLYFYVKPFSATDSTQNQTIYWRIDNLTDGVAPVEGSVTATLPTATTALRYSLGMQNLNNTSRNLRFQRAYVETDR